jgi:predicted nucleic acid-binding protein
MAIAVLDASVVIAFLNPNDRHHDAAVAAFHRYRREELVLPASVYAELLVGPFRRGEGVVAKTEGFIRDLAMRIEPISADIAKRAAFLRARHHILKLPDAFVLATGDLTNAARVLTADAAWSRISKRAERI